MDMIVKNIEHEIPKRRNELKKYPDLKEEDIHNHVFSLF